ncbi:hypothetical protein KC842_02620 [Candidatus Nomurabacteria bacterium]|nr:hypothetical protein [Candidatus Nomurabacteria bacterium]USN94612.1 MAG: hypothetical protein H6791_02525 [Candidatus Nomurabacteria bacterium]
MNFRQSKVIAILLILLVVALTIFSAKVDVREILNFIGVSGIYGYIAAVIIALSGGVSVATTASFYAAIGILAVSGLDPLILALVTAPALIIGDYIFYYLARRGKEAILEKNNKYVNKIKRFIGGKSQFFIGSFVYFYAGLTPFPSDILMVSLAVFEIRFRRIVLPLFLGHVTLVTLIGLLGGLIT